MKVILFDIFPAHGHYNGSFNLALLLQDAGYSIFYACPSDFMERIHAAGFRDYLFNPFLIPPDGIELKEKGFLRFMLENWVAVLSREKSRRIEENIKKYDEMIGKIQPDLIILDEHYAYKSIFYSKYKIPTVTIQTAVTPDYAPGIPPFNNSWVPDFSWKNKTYVEYLWWKYYVKIRINRIFRNIFAFGKSSGFYYRLYAQKYHFPYHKIIRKRLNGIRFENIPSLVVPPASFDFPRDIKRNLYFIGPLKQKPVQRDGVSKRLESVLEKVSAIRKRQPGTRLIYCSLGTVTGNYVKICRRFFRNMAKVSMRNPKLHIILSVGIYFDIAEIGNVPANLYPFDRVPQLKVLGKCDFVITHGGMNTVYESIMEERPMIVYPLSMDWDQNGNAARVVYHGIGLKGVLRRAQAGSIEKLLSELIANERKFKANIRHLKSKFEDRSAYTLNLIDHFTKNGATC